MICSLALKSAETLQVLTVTSEPGMVGNRGLVNELLPLLPGAEPQAYQQSLKSRSISQDVRR